MADGGIFENQARAVEAYGELVCGVDEAGRGSLAGPVCAAAVILRPDALIEGLNDSKKLSEKKRESIFDAIIAASAAYAIRLVDSGTIDETNILAASLLAMKDAVEALSVAPSVLLVDGDRPPKTPYKTLCIVGGDARVACISAASVLAKVTRDRLMRELDKAYPEYGFARHKGYGTREHYAAIKQYGVLDIHRKTFLKGIV